MAQVSFLPKHIFPPLKGRATPKKERRVSPSPFRRRFPLSNGTLLCFLGFVLLLFWNWKLLLATAVGAGAMLGIYLLPSWNWRGYWSSLQHFFNSSQRQLTLAIGGGGVAALLTYMAASIWADVENRWLAAGAIFQGLGTLLTLGLLSWQILSRDRSTAESQFDQRLSDLTHPDPLKRAIAVRQLTCLALQDRLNASDRAQISDYFRWMLSRESEPQLLRNALIDGLQALERNHPQQPLQIPLKLERPGSKISVRSPNRSGDVGGLNNG